MSAWLTTCAWFTCDRWGTLTPASCWNSTADIHSIWPILCRHNHAWYKKTFVQCTLPEKETMLYVVTCLSVCLCNPRRGRLWVWGRRHASLSSHWLLNSRGFLVVHRLQQLVHLVLCAVYMLYQIQPLSSVNNSNKNSGSSMHAVQHSNTRVSVGNTNLTKSKHEDDVNKEECSNLVK